MREGNKRIVLEAKHSDAEEGVACFYLECDDTETHKKVIQFFLDNDIIQKAKSRKLYNISFKLVPESMGMSLWAI